MVFQKSLLLLTYLSFKLSLQGFWFSLKVRQWFLCFVYSRLFVSFCFLNKVMRSLDLVIIALESYLLKKGIWLLRACFFLHRTSFFNVSNPLDFSYNNPNHEMKVRNTRFYHICTVKTAWHIFKYQTYIGDIFKTFMACRSLYQIFEVIDVT